MKIQLSNCRVQAARANLLKNNVRLAFEVALHDTMIQAKPLLSIMASEEMLCELTVYTPQFPITVLGFEDVVPDAPPEK